MEIISVYEAMTGSGLLSEDRNVFNDGLPPKHIGYFLREEDARALGDVRHHHMATADGGKTGYLVKSTRIWTTDLDSARRVRALAKLTLEDRAVLGL